MVSVMEVDNEDTMKMNTTTDMDVTTTTTTTTDAVSLSSSSNDTPKQPWEEKLLDAQEILSLSQETTKLRPTVCMHLESLGKRLQKESEALQRISISSTTTPLPSTVQPSSTSNTTNSNISVAPMILSSSIKYVPIDKFAFDAGGYNAPFVTLYIDLVDVGTISRDHITCKFTKSSFDLIVNELHTKSYRLYKDCLEKDINPELCKYIIKANKIIIKLAKVKTSVGYDYWTKLTDPKKGTSSSSSSKKENDPSASIMDMMKQMYDDGDDNMKKIIGETMMKQRNGELNRDMMGKGGGSGGLPGMNDVMDDDF